MGDHSRCKFKQKGSRFWHGLEHSWKSLKGFAILANNWNGFPLFGTGWPKLRKGSRCGRGFGKGLHFWKMFAKGLHFRVRPFSPTARAKGFDVSAAAVSFLFGGRTQAFSSIGATGKGFALLVGVRKGFAFWPNICWDC